ncbi:MAG: hypothetical protein P4L51_22660 [Puia sp.]|nr:hypothetical protein [Puia sp.]
MSSNINAYDFVDCLVVDFGINRFISSMYVVVEAYYPLHTASIRRKGLIKVTFNQILKLNVEKNKEFEFDILLPYDENGNDVKANEIYSIVLTNKEFNIIEVKFKSDFLIFSLQCTEMNILEL